MIGFAVEQEERALEPLGVPRAAHAVIDGARRMDAQRLGPLQPLVVLAADELVGAVVEEEEPMQLAPHLRLERQPHLVLGAQLLGQQHVAVALSRRRRLGERLLVGRLVEDAHLEQHLAEELRRAGQVHSDGIAAAQVDVMAAGAILDMEDPCRLLREQLVQQRRKWVVRQVAVHERLREATYHKAAVTTATTTIPVATGSASIPVMSEGTILAP